MGDITYVYTSNGGANERHTDAHRSLETPNINVDILHRYLI